MSGHADDRDDPEGSANRKRIARRYEVHSIPVKWKIPKRRSSGLVRAKPVKTTGAVVELSIIGAGIVCPTTYEAMVGQRLWVQWNDVTGWVIVRRVLPYERAPGLVFYGVEYAESPSALGKALFDHGVGEREGLPMPTMRPALDPFAPAPEPEPEPEPEPIAPLEFRPPPPPIPWDAGNGEPDPGGTVSPTS